MYKPQRAGAVLFAELLGAVADVDPEMRIRFTSPHPKDFSDDVLKVSLTTCKSHTVGARNIIGMIKRPGGHRLKAALASVLF